MNLGSRLRKARKHAGLSQKELEMLSGVSQKTISKLERGAQSGSSQIVPLATACKVRPEWLASSSGEMLPDSSAAHQQITPYIALTEEAKDLALAWQMLAEDKRNMLKELIFMEAALHHCMPWFRVGRPKNATYEQFERQVESSIDKLCHLRDK